MSDPWVTHWKDYYEVLQVSPGAEPIVISAAYRNLTGKYHPDKHPPEKQTWAHERTVQIIGANDVLSDASTRARYDKAYRARSDGSKATAEATAKATAEAEESRKALEKAVEARRVAEEARQREEKIRLKEEALRREAERALQTERAAKHGVEGRLRKIRRAVWALGGFGCLLIVLMLNRSAPSLSNDVPAIASEAVPETKGEGGLEKPPPVLVSVALAKKASNPEPDPQDQKKKEAQLHAENGWNALNLKQVAEAIRECRRALESDRENPRANELLESIKAWANEYNLQYLRDTDEAAYNAYTALTN